MAENFINAKALLGATATPIYACPVGAVAIVIGCQVTQTDIDLCDLDLWWTDASDAYSVSYMAKAIKIPPQVSYNPIGGKLVLNEGDGLHGASDVADKVYVNLSILEIS